MGAVFNNNMGCAKYACISEHHAIIIILCQFSRNIISIIPIRIHLVENGLKLGVCLSTLHEGDVIAEGAKTRLELLMLKLAATILVKMSAKNDD